MKNYNIPFQNKKKAEDTATLTNQVSNMNEQLAESVSAKRRVVYIEDAPYSARAGLDSTLAFQKAFDELNDNDVIIVPKGTFNIAAGLTNTKRISILGVGKDVSILNFTHTNGSHCITYNNHSVGPISRIKISGFTIIGNASTGDGLYLKYFVDSDVTDLIIKNCGRDGLHFEMGWVNDFSHITSMENGRHGIYCSELQAAYSEANAINIWKCNTFRNAKIGIVIGDETNSYSENAGYGVNIQDNHFSENGVGNVQVSGARVVTINEGNYFEVVGTNLSAGETAFHVHIGKRSGSGIGVCHEVTIEGNHFNAMNDSRYGANNTAGYHLVLDNVIGVNIGKNNFIGYDTISGIIHAKSGAKRVKIEPNSYYGTVPFLTDQTNNEVVMWEQTKNTLKLTGEFAGNTFINQAFENIIRNGDFAGVNASNVPYGMNTQSFTFAKDTDGALICTANGGGYAKVLYALPIARLDEFKGKNITLTVRCYAPATNTQNYVVFSADGVTEVTQVVPKTGAYTDIVVTRAVASNATKLEVGISCYNATTISGEKVYVKLMRAVKGQSSTAYQKNPADHHNENLTHYAEFILANLKTAADNTAASTAGVPLNGLYKDATGVIKIRTV